MGFATKKIHTTRIREAIKENYETLKIVQKGGRGGQRYSHYFYQSETGTCFYGWRGLVQNIQ